MNGALQPSGCRGFRLLFDAGNTLITGVVFNHGFGKRCNKQGPKKEALLPAGPATRKGSQIEAAANAKSRCCRLKRRTQHRFTPAALGRLSGADLLVLRETATLGGYKKAPARWVSSLCIGPGSFEGTRAGGQRCEGNEVSELIRGQTGRKREIRFRGSRHWGTATTLLR